MRHPRVPSELCAFLSPRLSGVTPDFTQALNDQFGNLDRFIERFNSTAAGVQGSGWGWLVYNKDVKRLQIVTTPNQDPAYTCTWHARTYRLCELTAAYPVGNVTPILGIDVWEHAYYLDYKNARPDYLKAIWKVVNWANVAERFEAAKKE